MIIKKSNYLILYSLFLLGVGIFYSGPNFMKNINCAIAAGSTGGGLFHMMPGDHHEQFYRYSLFYNNLLRGYAPYFTGYQFASVNFTEGLIFFPFTAIVGIFSFIFGPILAYNLMAIFSFVFVGLASYAMVFQITKSRIAGIVAGVFMATVPFRTSFLYGQMVYGVDAVCIPLIIYFIEKAKVSRSATHFFMAGLMFFFTATANFQLFYWFVLLLSPYFLYVFVEYFHTQKHKDDNKNRSWIWIFPGLFSAVLYIGFIFTLIKGSALTGGQNFEETLFYTPNPSRLFSKFNGNEKNVYLGWTALLVLPWLAGRPFVGFGFAGIQRKYYIPLMLFIFITGMFFVFGPVIDSVSGFKVYQFLFEHVPGFNGTRTPGRIMAVVIVIYSILLGFCITDLIQKLSRILERKIILLLSGIVLLAIVADFHVINPVMNTFDSDNKVYETISNKQTKVVTLPFQFISADYRNSTFLTYALKYDLRNFSGHSSFYPKKMDEYVQMLFSLNDGYISKRQYEWLRNHGYEYVVAHSTSWEPSISKVAVALLSISPYLEYIMSDNGIYMYRIRNQETILVSENILDLDFEKLAESIDEAYKSAPQKENVYYILNWYAQEIYTNQKPFRWMRGKEAAVAIPLKGNSAAVSFEYWSPNGQPLKITSNGASAKVEEMQLSGGWSSVKILLSNTKHSFAFLILQASEIFKSPPDSRDFGVQVRDISVRYN